MIFYVLQAHKDGVSNDDYRRQQHAHNKNCLVAFEKELNKKGQIGMVNKGLVFIYLKGELSRRQEKRYTDKIIHRITKRIIPGNHYR